MSVSMELRLKKIDVMAYLAFPLPLDLRLEAGGVESSPDIPLMEVSLSEAMLPDRLDLILALYNMLIIASAHLFLPPFFLGSSIASSSSSSGTI